VIPFVSGSKLVGCFGWCPTGRRMGAVLWLWTGYGQEQDLVTTTPGVRIEAQASAEVPLIARGFLDHAFKGNFTWHEPPTGVCRALASGNVSFWHGAEVTPGAAHSVQAGVWEWQEIFRTRSGAKNSASYTNSRLPRRVCHPLTGLCSFVADHRRAQLVLAFARTNILVGSGSRQTNQAWEERCP
jgi:hypothetical protein